MSTLQLVGAGMIAALFVGIFVLLACIAGARVALGIFIAWVFLLAFLIVAAGLLSGAIA